MSIRDAGELLRVLKDWKDAGLPFNRNSHPAVGMHTDAYYLLLRLLDQQEQAAAENQADERAALEIFFSYSHKDEKLRDKLETHLSQLKHEGLIKCWHDRKIGAGTEWKGQIDGHLDSAHIILLLVSSDFLASGYCYDVELARAMQRHEAKDARVIPIILRRCDWHNAPFGKLLAFPKDGRPVTQWKPQDAGFTDVAKAVRGAVAEYPARS